VNKVVSSVFDVSYVDSSLESSKWKDNSKHCRGYFASSSVSSTGA